MTNDKYSNDMSSACLLRWAREARRYAEKASKRKGAGQESDRFLNG
jgi:hypothetical protein